MNPPITPLRAASLGILLIALWLILLGVWHTFEIYFTISAVPTMGLTITFVTVALIVLWKTLPFFVGFFLFWQHRFFVNLFCGTTAAKNDERDSWNNTPLLAMLTIGLLGLFLFATGIGRFCGMYPFLYFILAVDNFSEAQWLIATTSDYNTLFLPVFYPIVLGFVFIIGACGLGNLIGKQIDKSLESPTETEEGKTS